MDARQILDKVFREMREVAAQLENMSVEDAALDDELYDMAKKIYQLSCLL